MSKMSDLLELIDNLNRGGAYHIRRGFSLADTTPLLCTNHLLEEVVELQAEVCISKDREATLDEASDVLAIFLHFIHINDIDLEMLATRCMEKLQANFTFDESEVISNNPGFTRRNRDD